MVSSLKTQRPGWFLKLTSFPFHSPTGDVPTNVIIGISVGSAVNCIHGWTTHRHGDSVHIFKEKERKLLQHRYAYTTHLWDLALGVCFNTSYFESDISSLLYGISLMTCLNIVHVVCR